MISLHTKTLPLSLSPFGGEEKVRGGKYAILAVFR